MVPRKRSTRRESLRSVSPRVSNRRYDRVARAWRTRSIASTSSIC